MPQCMLGCPPPSGADTPPRTRHPPRPGTPPGADTPLGADPPPPPGADTPLPPGSRLQHTVNERPVRILLEYILVVSKYFLYFFWGGGHQSFSWGH